MPAITVVDDENISIWYYPESKILHHQVHRFFYGKPWRDAFNKGAEAFIKYGADKYLSDDRQIATLTKEDQEWGEKDWSPQLVKAGWKYWAIVMPEKIIGQVTMKKAAANQSTGGVTTRIFSSPKEAKEWLEQCS